MASSKVSGNGFPVVSGNRRERKPESKEGTANRIMGSGPHSLDNSAKNDDVIANILKKRNKGQKIAVHSVQQHCTRIP